MESGFGGSVNLDKDCTSTDQYGCANAVAKWGDSLKVTYNTTVPKDLDATYKVSIAAKVNNVLPFNVDCAICGTPCSVTIPIIKKKITIPSQPCPIKANTYSGSTTAALPSKAPVPLKVTFTGTFKIADASGNTVISGSASGEVDP